MRISTSDGGVFTLMPVNDDLRIYTLNPEALPSSGSEGTVHYKETIFEFTLPVTAPTLFGGLVLPLASAE